MACLLAATVLLAPVVLMPSQIVDLYRATNQDPYPFPSTAAQSFVSPTNRLSSVGFFIYITPGTFPGRANATVTITREDTGEVVRTATRTLEPGVRIPLHIFRPTYFNFRPIEGSLGVAYRATFTPGVPGVALWGSGADAYPDGTAWVSGHPQGFDFAITTRHYGTLRERLGRLSRWAPLWVELPVAIIMLATTLGLAAVASRVAGTESAPDDDLLVVISGPPGESSSAPGPGREYPELEESFERYGSI